jgi:hypothetical protein
MSSSLSLGVGAFFPRTFFGGGASSSLSDGARFAGVRRLGLKSSSSEDSTRLLRFAADLAALGVDVLEDAFFGVGSGSGLDSTAIGFFCAG